MPSVTPYQPPQPAPVAESRLETCIWYVLATIPVNADQEQAADAVGMTTADLRHRVAQFTCEQQGR